MIEVLAACDHPLTITTKGALIERDLDLLAPMAAKNLVRVFVSIAMLDRELARKLDPRAAAPHRRLAKSSRRSRGPAFRSASTSRRSFRSSPTTSSRRFSRRPRPPARRHAGYTMLRLPREVAPLFREWLDAHYPLRAAHVMSIVQEIRGGRDNDPRFGARMHGQGQFADLIRKRFRSRASVSASTPSATTPLDTTRFRPPRISGQLDLF